MSKLQSALWPPSQQNIGDFSNVNAPKNPSLVNQSDHRFSYISNRATKSCYKQKIIQMMLHHNKSLQIFCKQVYRTKVHVITLRSSSTQVNKDGRTRSLLTFIYEVLVTNASQNKRSEFTKLSNSGWRSCSNLEIHFCKSNNI